MPHMDGVSATQLIREVHPDVPVVAMTSNIRPEDISHYFNWSKYFFTRFLFSSLKHLEAPIADMI